MDSVTKAEKKTSRSSRFNKLLAQWTSGVIDYAKLFSRLRHTDAGLLLSATVIGVVIGLFIVVFHWMMLSFESVFHSIFVATSEFPLMRFLAFPFIAGLGGLAVGLLNRTVFQNLNSEGIPTVVYAMHYEKGIIRGLHAVKTMLNAALSISSGGGAGRESPTILLGASLGSRIGQLLQLRTDHLKLLSAAGAAAAIGGIFNAPLGGIVFAVEVIVGQLHLQSFVPIVISSVMATATARFFLGNNALLVEPPVVSITFTDYLLLALAGMISGGVAIFFLKSYRLTVITIKRVLGKLPDIWKPSIGGLLAGSILAALPTMLETTYDPINKAIAGNGILWISALTILLKPVSAAITLGSGGEGGTFAPAMKTGAMFGFCFGTGIAYLIPGTAPGVYALVCASALIAGTFYAPLTGALVVFEICRNYEMLIPLIFAAIFSVFIVNRAKIHTFNPNQKKHEIHD
ncbi:chloride channel protein [bacterium]|nr:chloride channel protein [bacterium]